MINATIPWDLTPEYLQATNKSLTPGQSAYLVPRRAGNSIEDVTDFHPGQFDWSAENMPSVMYEFKPPETWYQFKRSGRPSQKRDAHGNLMWEKEPEPGKSARPILDFSILPDKIGTFEEWHFFEAWRRLDPRVQWSDILMRMEISNRARGNAVQMRAMRNWRPAFGMLAWHVKGKYAADKSQEDKLLKLMTSGQQESNSTRGLTPGLTDPLLGEQGGRIPLPKMKFGEGEARSCVQQKQDFKTGDTKLGNLKTNNADNISSVNSGSDSDLSGSESEDGNVSGSEEGCGHDFNAPEIIGDTVETSNDTFSNLDTSLSALDYETPHRHNSTFPYFFDTPNEILSRQSSMEDRRETENTVHRDRHAGARHIDSATEGMALAEVVDQDQDTLAAIIGGTDHLGQDEEMFTTISTEVISDQKRKRDQEMLEGIFGGAKEPPSKRAKGSFEGHVDPSLQRIAAPPRITRFQAIPLQRPRQQPSRGVRTAPRHHPSAEIIPVTALPYEDDSIRFAHTSPSFYSEPGVPPTEANSRQADDEPLAEFFDYDAYANS